MPTVRKSLGHKFTVNPVDAITEVDTYINVIKRREEILYRTSVPAQAANIAHVASGEVVSSDNLSIADRSTSLAANRTKEGVITTISGTKTLTIDTDNFVVTDIFTTESQTITRVPLFYKHILSTENIARDLSGDLSSGIELLKIEFLDDLLQPMGTPEISIDYVKGIIYNNLATEYNSTSDYLIYYVRYTINDGGKVKTFVDLLNNVTTYRIAVFNDLTAALQIKTDGRKVYLIEEVSQEFVVTLPQIGIYAFKPTAAARIKILPPVATSVIDPWYVRVANGKFFTNLYGTLYKYHIAEFLSQSFTPEPPLKLASEESTVLTDSLIKLDHQRVYQGTDHDLYIKLLISDRDDNGLKAFTTDSTIVGNVAVNGIRYEMWNNSSRIGIRSIDYSLGILQVEGIKLKSSYKIQSTYSYEEESYEVSILNFNPISNKDALTTRVSLFIDPDNPATSKTQTLFYLKSDQSGKVIESNWGDFDNSTGKHTDGQLIYYEEFPDFLQTTSSGLPNWISPDSHKFVDEYSVEGPASGEFLILGDVTSSEALGIEDLEIFDSRIRGGGIIDSLVDEYLLTYPETQWLWDIGYWDGIPYPGNASYMVEVPVTVMDGAGGRFNAAEIRSIIEKHTAFGVYPVVRAYGIDIEYTSVGLGETIKIEWRGRNTGEYSIFSADSALGHMINISGILVDNKLGHKFEVQVVI